VVVEENTKKNDKMDNVQHNTSKMKRFILKEDEEKKEKEDEKEKENY
jgi:hypothetical protein